MARRGGHSRKEPTWIEASYEVVVCILCKSFFFFHILGRIYFLEVV